ARLLVVAQAADAVVGAAELEGARDLKRLGLQQDTAADGRVQGRMLDQRRADGGGGDLAGGVDDAFEAGRMHRFPLTRGRRLCITLLMHANMILAIDQGTTSTRAIAFEVSQPQAGAPQAGRSPVGAKAGAPQVGRSPVGANKGGAF